jgi:glycerate 2-kinase
VDLQAIYLTTLERCAPDVLVKACIASMEHDTLPRNVVAIGKCAGALLDGVAEVMDLEHAFAAVPEGYPLPRTRAEIHIGGHPLMTAASFAAGRALLDFVDSRRDLLFLISGGGSACVEVALHSEEETAAANARLVASGLPIAAINAERRTFSAIKGGQLGERVHGRSVTLVYSDVSTGALADVASGPTIASASEATLIADNTALTTTAATLIGEAAVVLESQLEGDVEETAELLVRRAERLRSGQILVAGGEPTVVVRGKGRGGRCSELAVRFAMRSPFRALFASSDGVDGNSGAAGVLLPRHAENGAGSGWEAALLASASFEIAAQVGEPIMIAPTGNNLRDLYLVARD